MLIPYKKTCEEEERLQHYELEGLTLSVGGLKGFHRKVPLSSCERITCHSCQKIHPQLLPGWSPHSNTAQSEYTSHDINKRHGLFAQRLCGTKPKNIETNTKTK